MRKIRAVMLGELRATLRRPFYVILGLGVPIILGLIVLGTVVLNRGGTTPATAPGPVTGAAERSGYVDPHGWVRVVPAGMEQGLRPYADQAAARAALDAGEIDGYYVIPADWAATGALTYVRRSFNPAVDQVRAGALNRLLLANLAGGDARVAEAAAAPLIVTARSLAPERADDDNWLRELLPTLMVLLLYMVIVVPASGLVNAFTDEKKNRVMELVLTSTSPVQLVAGKMLALGLLGLLQTVLYGGVLWITVRLGGTALNVPPDLTLPPALWIWTVVGFLGGYAIYGGLMAGIGVLAPDVKETRGPTMLVMSPLILAYLFNMATIERPDSMLAVVLSIFPLTAQVVMIGRLAVTAVPQWQLLTAIVLQPLTALGVMLLVARLFRAQHLLAGQPLTTVGYLRALRGGEPSRATT